MSATRTGHSPQGGGAEVGRDSCIQGCWFGQKGSIWGCWKKDQAAVIVWRERIPQKIYGMALQTQDQDTCPIMCLGAKPQGKPKNTGVHSLSLLQWIFPTKDLNWGLLHCRWIPYQLSYEGSPKDCSPENKLVLFLPLVRYNSRI